MPALVVALAATLTIPSAGGSLAIDGTIDEPLWREARVLALGTSEFGAPFPAGGETRIAVAGAYLAVSARITEPGRVVAVSTGRDPTWWREDLVSWRFTVHLNRRNRTFTLSVNPLGAYRVDSTVVDDSFTRVVAAARLGAKEWTVEAAIPLEALAGTGLMNIERVRVPRPDAPELRWFWPAANERADFEFQAPGASGPPPSFQPAPLPARRSETPPAPTDPVAVELARAPAEVWSPQERERLGIARMVQQNLRARMAEAAARERRAWEAVRTLADWERFRAPRLAALGRSLDPFPQRTPLHAEVTRRADFGDGFIIENVVFESRPQLLVTANLYLPDRIVGRIPAIVVVHSHHAPKTQTELQDMGMTWARSGTAVLVMDQLGAGERLQSQPWPREGYYSRYALGMQLYLAGESLMKWMVWDLMRAIDLLLERPYIDPQRIVMLGAVAGGGDPAAVAAALDERVAAVIPFNFGEAGPEEHYTMGPREYDSNTADPGWGSWESTRDLRRSVADEFFPWFICASVAPRPFLYSFEIGWPKGVENEPAWARYKKVFGLYGKGEHLAEVDGFGPFPGPGECTNVGVALRKKIYPILNRWLGLAAPEREYHNPRPDAELMCLTPAVAAGRRPQPASALAAAIARERLQLARGRGSGLRDALRAKLGDIAPNPQAAGRVLWTKSLAGFDAEGIALETDPGISVPLLLIKPKGAGTERLPVVVVFAQEGKKRFLAERSAELAELLKARIAVCLADVRGAGETRRDGSRAPGAMSLAATELMLGNTMLGARIKDARTVVQHLWRRADLDPGRLLLWGDSLAGANPPDLALDRSPHQQSGPQIQQQAEPLGALLALFTALYEDRLYAVAALRGLASFLSVLGDRFCYVPLDVIVPGILEAGDIPDLIAALAPRAVLHEASVDGRNIRVDAVRTDVAGWLIERVRPAGGRREAR
ncbi:MAG: acetylxylan esterase [Acidobacteriota bacterium]